MVYDEAKMEKVGWSDKDILLLQLWNLFDGWMKGWKVTKHGTNFCWVSFEETAFAHQFPLRLLIYLLYFYTYV